MFRIKVCNAAEEAEYAFENKIRLLDALAMINISLGAPCGGRGMCGKCKVTAEGALSALSVQEQKLLSEEEKRAGVRLACEAYALGDCTVRLQNELSNVLLYARDDSKLFADTQYRVARITLAKTDLEKQESQEKRLLGIFSEDVCLSLGALRSAATLSPTVEQTVYAVCDEHTVYDLFTYEPRMLGAAIDIGTTTLAAYLVDLATGETLAEVSDVNPQKAYGADVISRIDASQKNDLQKCLVAELNSLIANLLEKVRADRRELMRVHCVGNTVMMHLLLGVSPKGIASTPFIPAFTRGQKMPASEIGLDYSNAVLTTGTCVSAYVGADTSAAVLCSGMTQKSALSLLIDIGTNGEIALGSSEALLCCSAAAGPAFEGAHIRCGSSAVQGAISKVELTDNGTITLQTIGNAQARSICGSGLVDAIAQMLQAGIIDETGRMDADETPDVWADRMYTDEQGLCFALTDDRSVFITQKDIREVQLAKAAIAAGIGILLSQMHRTYRDIECLYLAGGFGNYIDVHSACCIGLLPRELEGKTISLGNAAGAGARRSLVNMGEAEREVKIAQTARYIELSSRKDFSDCFAECMMFEEI